MFDQGESAQLTYGTFDLAAARMPGRKDDQIEVEFLIGYNPDRTVLESTRNYGKAQLLEKYRYLAFHQFKLKGSNPLSPH